MFARHLLCELEKVAAVYIDVCTYSLMDKSIVPTHLMSYSVSQYTYNNYWLKATRRFLFHSGYQYWCNHAGKKHVQEGSRRASSTYLYHHHQVPSSLRRLAIMILHGSRSWESLTRSSYRIPVHSVMFVIHSVIDLPLRISPTADPPTTACACCYVRSCDQSR